MGFFDDLFDTGPSENPADVVAGIDRINRFEAPTRSSLLDEGRLETETFLLPRFAPAGGTLSTLLEFTRTGLDFLRFGPGTRRNDVSLIPPSVSEPGLLQGPNRPVGGPVALNTREIGQGALGQQDTSAVRRRPPGRIFT